MNRIKTAKKEPSGSRKRKVARELNHMMSKYPKITSAFKPDSIGNLNNLNISSESGTFEVDQNIQTSLDKNSNVITNTENLGASLNVTAGSGDFSVDMKVDLIEANENCKVVENSETTNSSLNISTESGNFATSFKNLSADFEVSDGT